MKLTEIKQEVYKLTCTKDTQDLKKQRSDLTTNRDLRYKTKWEEILKLVIDSREAGLDVSLTDLDNSEQMLKESLFKIGRLSGLTDVDIEIDWQRIQLDSQYSTQFNEFNISIEDL